LFILGGLLILGGWFFIRSSLPAAAVSHDVLAGQSFVLAEYRIYFQETKNAQPEPARSAGGTSLIWPGVVLAQTKPLSGLTASGGPAGLITYRVQPGDSLSAIAQKFGVSLNTLLWANKVSKKSVLRVGQELTILPVSGVIHKVRPGETLGAIVLTYKADLEEVARFNEISDEGFIKDGQVLVIPGGVPPPPPAPSRIRSGRLAQINPRAYFSKVVSGARLTQGLHAFNAVDLANSCGAPIYSAAQGQIEIADGVGWNGGYGKFIKIRHAGGIATLYAHLAQILVTPGQSVGRGALIGRMGSTGRSSGCHVHFEVRGARNPYIY
jgi:murein DD-endopeptidase MepM/ murein hydrolase activator NlpD